MCSRELRRKLGAWDTSGVKGTMAKLSADGASAVPEDSASDTDSGPFSCQPMEKQHQARQHEARMQLAEESPNPQQLRLVQGVAEPMQLMGSAGERVGRAC